MATALRTQYLTPEEFEKQYDHEKPNYEYWFGEPIQKSMGRDIPVSRIWDELDRYLSVSSSSQTT